MANAALQSAMGGAFAAAAPQEFPWLSDKQRTWIFDNTKEEDESLKKQAQYNLYKQVLPITIANKKQQERITAKQELLYATQIEKDAAKKKSQETTLKMADLADEIRNIWLKKGYNVTNIPDDKLVSELVNKTPNWQQMMVDYLNGKNEDIFTKTGLKEVPVVQEEWNTLWEQVKSWVTTAAVMAGLWYWASVLSKDKLGIVQPREKNAVIEWKNLPIPVKQQRAWATILKDILWVWTNDYIDREAIIQKFWTEYKPVKTFDELVSQASYKLKDTPWSSVNELNKLITKYSTNHWYEYLKPLEDYRKELSLDPQVTNTKLDKIDEIIAKEQAFIKKNWDTLTTLQLQDRKKQLNDNLKRFLSKDQSILSEVDQIEQQSLNKLRDWAMKEVAWVDAGTPDAGKISKLNKAYQTDLQIKQLAEDQANKFKWVKTPTKVEKIVTNIRRSTKSTPIVNTLTNWMKSWEMSADQQTIRKLKKFMESSSKIISKGAEELKWRMPIGKLTTAIDPTGTPMLLETVFWLIEDYTKKWGFTNTEAKKFKDSFKEYNDTNPWTAAAKSLFADKKDYIEIKKWPYKWYSVPKSVQKTINWKKLIETDMWYIDENWNVVV